MTLRAEIARLRELERAATKGPWKIEGATHVWSPSAKANVTSCSAPRTISHVGYAPPEYESIRESANNADLIAASRNALPRLLAAIERMEGALVPFSRLLQDHHTEMSNEQPIFGINAVTITKQHLINAAQALLALDAEGEST